MKSILPFCTLTLAWSSTGLAEYPIQPVPFTAVQVDDAFWTPRLETNRVVTLPHNFQQCDLTGRLRNFDLAAGKVQGFYQGLRFNDSDVYKVVQAAAHALATRPDPTLERQLDEVIARIAAAQQSDGYLFTAMTTPHDPAKPVGGLGKQRWLHEHASHELYCAGHLYEAAAAHYEATGKRTLLDVALKNAALVAKDFGPGRLQLPTGHQEIEIGLVRLFRVTGERKHLELAKFFLDMRGRDNGDRRLMGEYHQDHVPVLEQTEAVGHAVRAAYQYMAMADLAAFNANAEYLPVLDQLWQNVVSRKFYVTGGIGGGNSEGFSKDYVLPTQVAYNETCSSIAQILWSHRMFLHRGDASYLDALELTLYNAFLSGVGLSGDLFFYPNRLASDQGSRRSPWFPCACCPPNVARFLASFPGLAYAHRDDTAYVNLFVGGTATLSLAGGKVLVRQETGYPWAGAVKLTVRPEKTREFELAVRVPGWARNVPVPGDLYRFTDTSELAPTLRVNGKSFPLHVESGFARLRRTWSANDVVELDLPMPARRMASLDKVEATARRTVVSRGPIVYCAEGVDQEDPRVLNHLLSDSAPLTVRKRPEVLGGIAEIKTTAALVHRDATGTPRLGETRPFTLIPYYANSHRDRTPLTVWLARELTASRPLPRATLATSGTLTASANIGNLGALVDQLPPRSSGSRDTPFVHWWPRKNTTEWIELAFPQPTKITEAEVYWFDDGGGCRLPRSWRILARVDGQWQPVVNLQDYPVAADSFNTCTFEPVVASAVRLEVLLPEKSATGIHEFGIR